MGDFLGFFFNGLHAEGVGLGFPGCYWFNEVMGEGVRCYRGPAMELGTPANGQENGYFSDW